MLFYYHLVFLLFFTFIFILVFISFVIFVFCFGFTWPTFDWAYFEANLQAHPTFALAQFKPKLGLTNQASMAQRASGQLAAQHTNRPTKPVHLPASAQVTSMVPFFQTCAQLFCFSSYLPTSRHLQHNSHQLILQLFPPISHAATPVHHARDVSFLSRHRQLHLPVLFLHASFCSPHAAHSSPIIRKPLLCYVLNSPCVISSSTPCSTRTSSS